MTDETRPLEEAREGSPTHVAGQTFGRYVLVRRIGAGGCGEVFAAYDPILDRRIALKVLFGSGNAGWAREARMLAKVDHPRVVTVHDAGVEDGRGYLATELVDGPSLDAWLVEHARTVSPRERLALLLPIAAALGEAHARGIVHGDVKPANILVADDQARITDFGVARAIDNECSTEPYFAGTPAYMAPEQLEGRPPTEASDQYAFCLTLCEALSNAPIASSQTDRTSGASETREGSDGMRRDLSASRTAIPVAGLDRAITAALRRGLHPDPSRRFASMQALVDAMVTVPRRRRTIRRLVAGAVLLSTGVGAAVYASSRAPEVCTGAELALAEIWNDDRETTMRAAIAAVDVPGAAEESARVGQAIDAYAQAWKAQHAEICLATSVRKEQSAAAMDAQMSCMQHARGRLAAAVDIFSDADEGVLRNATPTVESLIPLDECLDLQRLTATPEVPIPEGKEDAVRALSDALARSQVQVAAGRFSDARDTADAVLSEAREVGYPPVIANAQYQLAASLAQRGDLDQAAPRGRESLRLALQDGRLELALMASSMLAFISSQSGSPEHAEAYETMARGLIDRPEITPRIRANALVDLATVVYDAGRYQEARDLYAQALEFTIATRGEDDWRVAHAIDNVAMADMSLGNDRAAIEGFERALALREASLGEGHVNHVLTLIYLGGLRSNLGELDGAQQDFERALRIAKAELGKDHPWIAASTDGLARVALERGELDRAKTLAGEALALLRARLGPEHPFVANSLLTVGRVDQARGDYATAEADFETMIGIMEATMDPAHPQLGEAYRELGVARLSQGHFEAALEPLDAALAIEDSVGIPPVERLDLLTERGLARLALGRAEDAAADLQEAARLLGEASALEARDFVPLFAQGRFHQARGEAEAAHRWFERARSVADSPSAKALVEIGEGRTGVKLQSDPALAVAVATL